jgi:Ethylbenzene dehydrogenase/Prokaryotic cytochrome b561
MAFGRRQRTDCGTTIFHAVLLGCVCVLLATGLRIASDDPEAAWLSMLDPMLPMENLWYRHLVAGTILSAGLVGYGIYVVRARLSGRLRFDRTRLVAIWRGGEPRFAALNVAVVWLLLGSLVLEILTGVVIFWDAGQAVLDVHRLGAWFCVACVMVHVVLHACYGGIQQILRIVRPSRLRVPEPPPDLAELLAEQLQRRSLMSDRNASSDPRDVGSLHAHPLATSLAVVLMVVGLACGSETLTRPVLTVAAITKQEAPFIDGDLSDPVWAKAVIASIVTTQGGDFGGTHQSRVEIRALHDGEFAYFAFTWEDPTRSLKHMPLVKDQAGWHVASTRSDRADESVYNEDKFAVLLSPSVLPLIGAAIHLAKVPLPGKPGGSSGRGLHYTSDGSILDVWQWRASHQGAGGHVDNCHIGGPRVTLAVGEVQYSGGFAVDPGPSSYEPNFPVSASSVGRGLRPRRLPRDPAAMTQAMGRISDATNESESENARWWMLLSESVPYSPNSDAAIPLGTVIPGIIMLDTQDLRQGELAGFGRWAAGRWTLEIVRRLNTGSAYDVEIKSNVLMWVAAFDHSEKRHTRHLRPFRLRLE